MNKLESPIIAHDLCLNKEFFKMTVGTILSFARYRNDLTHYILRLIDIDNYSKLLTKTLHKDEITKEEYSD
jgi:hypothetical protein